jgi:hypothetical protein
MGAEMFPGFTLSLDAFHLAEALHTLLMQDFMYILAPVIWTNNHQHFHGRPFLRFFICSIQ